MLLILDEVEKESKINEPMLHADHVVVPKPPSYHPANFPWLCVVLLDSVAEPLELMRG